MNGFSQVQPKNEKSSSVASHNTRISSAWMMLLLNLSFSIDGLSLLTKTEGKVKKWMKTSQHTVISFHYNVLSQYLIYNL